MLGGGAILASALLDKPVDKFMKRHADAALVRDWGKAGKATPVLFAGAAGAALLFGDARAENAGFIALESMAAAGAISIATKRVVGRARPDEELGQFSATRNRSNASFPSNHSTVAFAAITPFAQGYARPDCRPRALGVRRGRRRRPRLRGGRLVMAGTEPG
jgi:membrane-associated phospholipid phosphatase